MTEQDRPRHDFPIPSPHPGSEGTLHSQPSLEGVGGAGEGPEERVREEGAERSEALADRDLSGEALARSAGASGGDLEDRLQGLARAHRRGPRSRVKAEEAGRPHFTARQRLLLLDTWLRSKLPAKDFGALVGTSRHTLYKWKHAFLQDGPAGLTDQPRKKPGCRLTEEVKRAILMLKEAHPDWGQDRISAVLARTEAYGVSATTVGRFLDEAGYQVLEVPTRPHPDKVRRFERARPNQLWQTDLFTFVLKRENRRVHLVAYMDDHSRFIVAFGLHATASGELVREVFESGIVHFGPPEEVLTDNGTQYHSWRGTSAFRKFCDRRGIRQIVARPRHPQTLGKIERFWGTLWRELLAGAIFRGMEEARRRIGHFIDHYNFQRPHQGIENLVPADRYFEAAAEVKETLRARIHAKALELARHGEPRKPFYLTGRVGDSSISMHAEGERVVMTQEGKKREEVDLGAPGKRGEVSPSEERPPHTEEGVIAPFTADSAPEDPAPYAEDSHLLPPGVSPLDGRLAGLMKGLQVDGAIPAGEASGPPGEPEERPDGDVCGTPEVAP